VQKNRQQNFAEFFWMGFEDDKTKMFGTKIFGAKKNIWGMQKSRQ